LYSQRLKVRLVLSPFSVGSAANYRAERRTSGAARRTRAVLLALASLIGSLAASCAQESSPTDDVDYSNGAITLAPGWVTGSTWPAETVVALNSVALRGTSLVSGDVGVIRAGSGAFLSGSAELALSSNAEVIGNVRADTVDMQVAGHVRGNAAYNQLTGVGAIDGTKTTTLSTPLPITVVTTANFTAGTTNVDVPAGTTVTKNGGNYNLLNVQAGSRTAKTILRLNSGTYNVGTIAIGDFARLECKGACTIRVKNRISAGSWSYVGPGGGTSQTMDQVKLFVEGGNGVALPSGTPAAAAFGQRSELKAFTFVPNGTLMMGPSATCVGKFIALDVDVGTDTELLSGSSTQSVLATQYVVGASWPDEVVTAWNSLDVLGSMALTGNSAVIQDGAGSFLNTSEAVIATGATLTGNLRADKVELKSGARVSGSVGYNTLVNAGTVGSLVTPLLQPLDIRVPVFPVISAGSSSYTVKARLDQTLGAGRYRDVTLTAGISGDPTVLTLSGGVYQVRNLTLGNYSNLICSAACEIWVTTRLSTGDNSSIVPAAGVDISNIKLFVNGNTGSTPASTPFAVSFGVSNTISAFVFAPRGTLESKSGAILRGRFVARDVRLGSSSMSQRAGTTELAPTIQQQPQSVTIIGGQSATFGVAAAGTDVAFQWKRNGVAIAGATSGSYTLSNAVLTDSGVSFTVTVSNSVGSITSSAAILTVNACNPATYVPVATACGVGACARTGTSTCIAGSVVDSCVAGTPAATDATCNGIDDDCDGVADDDYLPTMTTCALGACASTGTKTCVAGTERDSCTSSVPAANDPTCDGRDDDCDGKTDENYAPLATNCGIGACAATGVTACVGGVAVDSCDPGAPASSDADCDGVDDDCDGAADQDYVSVTTMCGTGACKSMGVTDCVDGTVTDTCRAGTNAPSDPTCNGVDDDCDGKTDENYAPVATSCGVGACAANGVSSCVSGTVKSGCTPGTPAASDTTCNGVDDNCNGTKDEGYVAVTTNCGVGACAATGATSCVAGSVQNSCAPGTPAPTDTTCNGVDDNCNGTKDEGYISALTTCGTGACAATGATSCVAGNVQNSCAPGAPAPNDVTCDGVDDNCNGTKDEGYISALTTCGTGACAATGATSCVAGNVQNSCAPGTPAPTDVTCDGVDDNCNGTKDEGYVSSLTTCGTGACAATGATSCVAGNVQNSCAPGAPAPNDVTCDGVDDNCNGTKDEGYVSSLTTCGTGACAATGATSCVAGNVQNSCAPGAPAPNDVTCDSVDDNCNGTKDEGYISALTTCGTGACAATGATSCVAGNVQNSCAVPTADGDGDGAPNCSDGCPIDPAKTAAGACGCGTADADGDQDGALDCLDNCPTVANAGQQDSDNDGQGDACDMPPTIAIAAGGEHSCALLQNHSVSCWGDNSDGQLGDGSYATSSVPTLVSGLSDAIEVTGGHHHTCAVRTTGAVVCWGANASGQLGNGSTSVANTPVAVSGISDAVHISAGREHSCAVRSTGDVMCWGANESGQLGNGTLTASSVPVAVSGLTGIARVAAGYAHTCAVRTDHGARCWGANESGELGNGTLIKAKTPVIVTGLADAALITVGDVHSCALRTGGGVKCWGANWYGALGNGTQTDAKTPVVVTGLADAVQLEAGELQTCAIRATGQVVCWGYNADGELGDETLQNRAMPVATGSFWDALQIALGNQHGCALRTNAEVDCWGLADKGQLGHGMTGPSKSPVRVANIADGSSVAVGSYHACALRASGGVDCWGIGSDGQLGNGATENTSAPVHVSGVSDAIAIVAGSDHACALRAGGQVVCWGYGDYGQLGDGNASSSSTPVTVAGLSDATAIAAGDDHVCAVRAGGSVACWGYGGDGELGNGGTSDAHAPVPVSGISDALAIAAGSAHVCALRSGGQVACWGVNAYGQLGDGSSTARSTTPVAVSGIANAVAIGAGSSHSCAVLSTGQVRCWGSNADGQLGTGDKTPARTPVSVSNISNAIAIAGGSDQSCALLSTGALRCWGANDEGQLGDGTTTPATTPVAVLGISDATEIDAGFSATCAVRAGGEVRCWGSGEGGKLGNRYPWSSSPVRVAWPGQP
jgi:alpha-tubulin suppressor-like RCC1 family protein